MTTKSRVVIRIFLWAVLIVVLFYISLTNNGCFSSVEALRQQDYSTWTAEDCMALVMANTHHNLRKDGTIIYSLVTPFTPEVVRAIGRLRQLKEGVSDSLTYEFIQRLTKDGTGLYLDRDGTIWDRSGNRFSPDRDSLLVMVNLVNKTWPCEPITINGVPIQRLSDVVCQTPDITRLEEHIYLRTAGGDTIYPKFIYGRRHTSLTSDENLLAMFDLQDRPEGEIYYFTIDAFIKENQKETVYPL